MAKGGCRIHDGLDSESFSLVLARSSLEEGGCRYLILPDLTRAQARPCASHSIIYLDSCQI